MNIVLIYQNLPVRVRALTTVNDDGSYTIIINGRQSWEIQKAAVLHELAHIQGNDFSSDVQADILEALLHRHPKKHIDINDIQFFIAG